MLTDAKVRAAVPIDGKARKIADAGNLFLLVTAKGHKSWRYKFRFGGKEKLLVLGSYPDMSLAKAREGRDRSRLALREGRDPTLAAKRARALATISHAATFESFARAWHEMQKGRWKEVHANDVITSMERDLFPEIGAFPVDQIDEPLLLAALRKVEARGAYETCHRLRQRAARVFRYAKGAGAPNSNPAIDVAESLKPVPKGKRWPAITDVDKLRVLIRHIDEHEASPIARLASRLLALTAQRPGMVRRSRWTHFEGVDWDDDGEAPDAIWRVPSDELKQELDLRESDEFEHLVPLPRQAVETLRTVRTLTGRGPLAFPNNREADAPLSENTIGYMYNRAGYKGTHVPHGWRSSFSTIMNGRVERSHPGTDRLLIDRLIIDQMLAHRPAGMSESEFAYNRSRYMDRRRELATQWADLLMMDALPASRLIEGARRKVGR